MPYTQRAMEQIRFGTDGWRGVIAEDFTFANLRGVITAIARWVIRNERAERGIFVGYDHRFGSEHFARVAAETLAAADIPVWLATASSPSPAISLAVRRHGAAAGIVITASHNPPRWNGVKVKASYGSSASPEIIAGIERELACVDRLPARSRVPRPERIQPFDIRSFYLNELERLVDWGRLQASGLRFVFDPMHGSAAGLLPELLRRHGIACEEIRGRRDPLFGGYNPEPIPANLGPLQNVMATGRYDAGFVTDGDGDRIAAMDASGRFITAHQCFSILLWHLAGTRGLPGDVAKTFSVTKLVDRIAGHYGRRVHETPVGFKYICALMLERNILIGGEESGGIGLAFHLPERDATVSALLLAEVMAWHGRRLAELVEDLHRQFGTHFYERADVELEDGRKERVLAALQQEHLEQFGRWPVRHRETLDGVKLYLGDDGWLMFRASGTEPLLRIYAESHSEAITKEFLQTATRWIGEV